MTTLTELRNRAIRDTLIVCCDGLKGLPDAIRTWPQAEVQLCVVHLVRSSLRYTSKKHWGRICAELREIYTAPTPDAADARFDEFAETWRDRYPAMIRTWEQSWGEFVPFLEFPVELRTLVYTTDEIVNGSRRVSWVASGRSSPRRRVRGVRRGRVRGAGSPGRCSRSRGHVDRVPGERRQRVRACGACGR
jgi:transposase-like protein